MVNSSRNFARSSLNRLDRFEFYLALLGIGGRPLKATFPSNNPISFPRLTNWCNSANFRLRSARISRVSRPWMVLASAHRLRPCSVFGPVDNPPWFLQTSLPMRAGALHWFPVRLLVALHCLHSIRPPQVINVKFVDMFYTLIVARSRRSK